MFRIPLYLNIIDKGKKFCFLTENGIHTQDNNASDLRIKSELTAIIFKNPYGKKEDIVVNGQSYKLVKKCSKGVKMGIVALDEMANYCHGQDLRDYLSDAVQKHREVESSIDDYIRSGGREVKGVNKISVWFAKKGIAFKFAGKQADEQIRKSVSSSCDKAIMSLCKDMCTYSLAEKEAVDFCKKVISLEEETKDRAQSVKTG